MNESCLQHSNTIHLHKDIFMRNHTNELVNSVKQCIENGVRTILIDFTEVENIPLVGLGILTKVQKISITNNTNIQLINVMDNVKKIIDDSCLIFDIHTRGEEEDLIHEEIALIA